MALERQWQNECRLWYIGWEAVDGFILQVMFRPASKHQITTQHSFWLIGWLRFNNAVIITAEGIYWNYNPSTLKGKVYSAQPRSYSVHLVYKLVSARLTGRRPTEIPSTRRQVPAASDFWEKLGICAWNKANLFISSDYNTDSCFSLR